MKVLLIYPRYSYANAGGVYPPLGLLYLAATLRERGHVVSITDMIFQEDPNIPEEKLESVDVVGISFSTPLAGRAFEVLKALKKMKKELLCVAGGPHPTVSADECLQNGFDVCVIGEGEYTFVDILDNMSEFKSLKRVSGIAIMDEGQILFTPPRPLVDNLDVLPFPARDLIDWDTYLKMDPSVNIMTSRGCPYQCLFCMPIQEKLFGKKVRRRSPSNVVDEIQKISQEILVPGYVFGILEDTFTFSKAYIQTFCAEIVKRDLKINWWCHARVDNIDEEMLRAMKNAGCVHLSIGVESGSQRILDFLKKGIKVADIIRAFDICNKVEIFTHAYIIIGSPMETIKDLRLTAKLLDRIRPCSVGITRLTPMKGSYLYDYATENGLINVTSFDEWDYCSNANPLILKHLTSDDLDHYTKKMKDIIANRKRRPSFFEAIQKVLFS